MDRAELLKKLGLSEDELRDLQRKFAHFQAQLNENQLGVIKRSLPTLEEAQASVPEGAREELLDLLNTDASGSVTVVFFKTGVPKF